VTAPIQPRINPLDAIVNPLDSIVEDEAPSMMNPLQEEEDKKKLSATDKINKFMFGNTTQGLKDEYKSVAKGALNTTAGIFGTAGKAADKIDSILGIDNGQSFFTGVSKKLQQLASNVKPTKASTTRQKVGEFAGSLVPGAVAGTGVMKVVEPIMSPIAAKMLGNTATRIASKFASKPAQAFVGKAITSLPSEVVGGIGASAIVDPNSVDTPEGLAFAGGVSAVGSLMRGIGAARTAQKMFAVDPATNTSPFLKMVDDVMADVKLKMDYDPLVNNNLADKISIVNPLEVAKPGKGFKSTTIFEKDTPRPLTPALKEIKVEGEKILNKVATAAKQISNIQKKMEVDGVSTERLDEIAKLQESMQRNLDDYNREIVPYMNQEFQNTSTVQGTLPTTAKGIGPGVTMAKTPQGANLNPSPPANLFSKLVNRTPVNPTVSTWTDIPSTPGVNAVTRFINRKGRDIPIEVPSEDNGWGRWLKVKLERPKIPDELSEFDKFRMSTQDYKRGLSIFGTDVRDATLPLNIAHRLSGSTGRAFQNLKIQPMLPDPNSPGNYIPADALPLTTILERFGTDDKSIEYLGRYVSARQVVEGNLNAGTTMNDELAHINYLLQQRPDLAWAGNELFKRTKVQAEYMRPVFGDAVVDAWEKYNYMPANRNLNTEGSKTGFLDRRKGGDGHIFDPISRHVENTVTAIMATEKTKLWQEIWNRVNQDKEGWTGLVDIIPLDKNDPQILAEIRAIQQSNPEISDIIAEKVAGVMSSLKLDKTNRTVTFKDKGEWRRLAFHEDFDMMFDGFAGSPSAHPFVEALRKAEGVPRTLFSLFNDTVGLAPFRDIINSVTNDPSISVQHPMSFLKGVFADPVRGMYHILTKSKEFQQVMAAGGSVGGRFISEGHDIYSSTYKDLKKEIASPVITNMNPLTILNKMSSALSQANRMGAALRVFDAGGTADEAATMFRYVIADPQQVGAKMQSLARITAFMNMGIQDIAKTGDMAFKNGKFNAPMLGSLAAKGATLISVPSAILWFYGKDDKEIQQLRKSKNGEQYFYMRLGEDQPIFAWRKPFLYGQVFGTGMEAALDSWNEQDPEGVKRFAKGLIAQTSVNVIPLTLQTMVAGVTRNKFNGIFEGSSEFGGSTSNQMGQDQRTMNTTTSARKLSEALGGNISAAWIDDVFRTFLTTEGYRAFAYADRVSTNRTAPASSDKPFIGGFFPSPTRTNTQALNKFYDEAMKHTDVLASLKDAEAKGNAARIEAIIQDKKPQLIQALTYGEALQEMQKMRAAVNIINENEMMTPEERRTKIDEITKAMQEFAQAFVKGVSK